MNNSKSISILLVDISTSMSRLIRKVNNYIDYRKKTDANSECLIITFGTSSNIVGKPSKFKNIGGLLDSIEDGTLLSKGLSTVGEYLENNGFYFEQISLLIFTDGKITENDKTISRSKLFQLQEQFAIIPYIIKLNESQLKRVQTIFPDISILEEDTQRNYGKILIYSLFFIAAIVLIKIRYFSKNAPQTTTNIEQKETNTIKKITSIKTQELYNQKPKNFLVYAKGKTYGEIMELYNIKNENDKKVIFNVFREYNRQFIDGDIWSIKLTDTINTKYIKVPNLSSMLLDTLDEGNGYSTLYSKQKNNELKFISIERVKKNK